MMKREIKFRGKRKDNGEWVTGSLITENPPLQCFASENKEPNKYLIGKSGFADWNMSRPFTAAEVYSDSVGQYVESIDKNKKEIYEGDIVRCSKRVFNFDCVDEVDEIKMKDFISFVEYRGHGFWVHDEGFGWEGEDLWDWEEMEVIGNIYENSELLK